jgi:hypothetical protein
MAEAAPENPKCANCGAEPRPDTQFCYNCGKHLESAGHDDRDPLAAEEENKSLADLEKALAASRENDGKQRTKLDTAARERRKARIAQRKPVEIVWNAGSGPSLIYVGAVAVIFILVLFTVVLIVFWK